MRIVWDIIFNGSSVDCLKNHKLMRNMQILFLKSSENTMSRIIRLFIITILKLLDCFINMAEPALSDMNTQVLIGFVPPESRTSRQP